MIKEKIKFKNYIFKLLYINILYFMCQEKFSDILNVVKLNVYKYLKTELLYYTIKINKSCKNVCVCLFLNF